MSACGKIVLIQQNQMSSQIINIKLIEPCDRGKNGFLLIIEKEMNHDIKIQSMCTTIDTNYKH